MQWGIGELRGALPPGWLAAPLCFLVYQPYDVLTGSDHWSELC